MLPSIPQSMSPPNSMPQVTVGVRISTTFYSTGFCVMCLVAGMEHCGRTLAYGKIGSLWMEMVCIRQNDLPLVIFGHTDSIARLQLRILLRAMRMLKKNGRIVYSTCSMNPVENEAVIAAALVSKPGLFFIL